MSIELSSENISSINELQEFTNCIKKNCLIIKSIIYNVAYISNKPIIISLLSNNLKRLTINSKHNNIDILHFPDSLEELNIECNIFVGKVKNTNIKKLRMIFNIKNNKTFKKCDIDKILEETNSL